MVSLLDRAGKNTFGVASKPETLMFKLSVVIVCWCSCFALVACAPKTPAAGWCRAGHRPNKAAQSGYRGYCKPCLRKLFPEEHAAKRLGRSKMCAFCGDRKELTSAGLCKPCAGARTCQRCDGVNMDSAAVVCRACADSRTMLGATKQRLAIWCPRCFSESERASGRCLRCQIQRRERCKEPD